MTKAQQTFERINALVESGKTKADSFKQLAEEYGQPVDSVRGAYYGHKRVLERGDEPSTGTRRPRRAVRASGRRPPRTPSRPPSPPCAARSTRSSSSWKRLANGPTRPRPSTRRCRPPSAAGSRRSGPRSRCSTPRPPTSRWRRMPANPQRPSLPLERRPPARSGSDEADGTGLGVEQSLPRVPLLTPEEQSLHTWIGTAVHK